MQAPRGCVGVWLQPLGSQAQVEVQMDKSHYPKGAKGELLGPGHHKGRRRATRGAEEKDKWVWQRRPPMWAESCSSRGHWGVGSIAHSLYTGVPYIRPYSNQLGLTR